jgi:DNA-binding response OmpR family regulator
MTLASSNGSGHKKRVVLVEDDADFGELVALMLAESGIELVPATSGRAALLAMEERVPDLVILDLMLPDMSGWDVFINMRGAEATAHVPVIILCIVGTRHDRSFGLQIAQVHDYVVKPCLPSRLRASVASALALEKPA